MKEDVEEWVTYTEDPLNEADEKNTSISVTKNWWLITPSVTMALNRPFTKMPANWKHSKSWAIYTRKTKWANQRRPEKKRKLVEEIATDNDSKDPITTQTTQPAEQEGIDDDRKKQLNAKTTI